MIEVTPDMLKQIVNAPTKSNVVNGVITNLPEIQEKYEINTKLRLAHFLAQIGWESDHFRALEEYASGAAYEGRKDLGNIYPGDGRRYKGRGVIQCTGRHNYKKYGDILGLDLINHPEWAATPHVSMLLAGEYWKTHNLNKYADADNVSEVTRRINGGYNGLAGRVKMLKRAKAVLAKAKVT